MTNGKLHDEEPTKTWRVPNPHNPDEYRDDEVRYIKVRIGKKIIYFPKVPGSCSLYIGDLGDLYR